MEKHDPNVAAPAPAYSPSAGTPQPAASPYGYPQQQASPQQAYPTGQHQQYVQPAQQQQHYAIQPVQQQGQYVQQGVPQQQYVQQGVPQQQYVQQHPQQQYVQQPQHQQQFVQQPQQAQPIPQKTVMVQQAQPMQFTYATPLQSLNQGSAPVDCPACGQRAMTNIALESGSTTHTWALLFCFFFCLGCIPYLMDSLKDVQHRCGRCGALLATWHRGGGTVVHMHGPIGGVPMQQPITQ